MNHWDPFGWRQQLVSALMLLLFIACGLRLVAELIKPILPGLIVLTVLGGVIWIIRRRRYY